MPKLWTDTLDSHRHEVRDAILNATAALCAESGPLGVTMVRVAETTGIGRATLYKYFPDVASILVAWHQREVGHHLENLRAVGRAAPDPFSALTTVLESYAEIRYQHHAGHLDAVVGGDGRLHEGHDDLHGYVTGLVAAAAEQGSIRHDVAAIELATFCLSALDGVGRLRSKAAAKRLVGLTLDGLASRSNTLRDALSFTKT